MWTGKISMFNDYGSHIEMRIESLSSITVLFGRSSLGYFACMPDFKASCHLIHPENERYNKEKLISVMNPIDGITVARALNVLFENLNWLIVNGYANTHFFYSFTGENHVLVTEIFLGS